MNKRGHVLNAIVLSVGLACLAHPSLDAATVRAAIAIGVPVTLGALIPDVDTAFGTHRKTLHNLPVLILFFVYPHYFGNLQFVWIGVATHYVLDLFDRNAGSRCSTRSIAPSSTSRSASRRGVATPAG